MKIKKKFLRILLVLLIVLTLSVVLINGKKISHAFSSLINKQAGTTLREDDLSNVVNDMYITLLDEKANVIATTNPNTTVHSDYVFSATSNPRKLLSFDKKYTLLYEVKDTSELESKKSLLKENVIYNMQLPEHMEGYEIYDGSIVDNCYEFVSDNDLTACGGIYEGNVMKILFSNIGDRYDITFNYQYYVKFDKALMETNPSIQTFDFGKFGPLQLMFEGEPSPTYEAGDNYELTTSYNGETSDTYNYLSWDVSLKDVRDTKEYNGYLDIDIDTYMSLVLDRDNPYEYIDIYVDGNKLNKKYNAEDTFNGCFYNDINDCLIPFAVAGTRSIDAVVPNNTVMVYEYKVYLNSDDLDGVGEVKVSFDVRNHSTYTGGNKTLNYTVTANYYDSDNTYDLYESRGTGSVYYGALQGSLTSNVGETNVEHGEPYNSINSTLLIDSSNRRNYATIDTYHNYDDTRYYMNSKGFLASSPNISDTFTIKINDQEVQFERLDDLNAYYFTGQEIDKVDPGVQYQLSITDSYSDNLIYNVHNILRGPKNADGDYYYLVVSKSTMTVAGYNSDGNNIHDINGDGASTLGNPTGWRIYLFNIAGAKVEIKWTSYLERINYDRTDNEGSSFNTQIALNSYNYYTKSVTSSLYAPAVIRTEALNDGYYKWDVVLDAQAIRLSGSTIPELGLNLYLPSNFTAGGYDSYNATTNQVEALMVGDGNSDVYLNTNNIYVCTNETDGKIKDCTNYQSLGDVTFATGKLGSNYSYSAGKNYHFTANNVPVRDDGFVHLVFFSMVNYNAYDYDADVVDEVAVEFLITDNINQYNGATTMGGNSPMLRYDLLLKSSYSYPDVYGNSNTTEIGSNKVETNVNSLVYFPYTSRYNTNCGDTIGHSHYCWNPIGFNGRYQFYISSFDDMEYVDLNTLTVNIEDFVNNHVATLAWNIANQDFEENYVEICDSNTNIPCLSITRHMSDTSKYGYLVEVYNLEDIGFIDISYTFLSDFSGRVGTVNIYGTELDMDSYYVPFRTYKLESSTDRIVEIHTSLTVKGDLLLYDNVEARGEFKQKINTVIKSGNSPTDYVEVEPFVVAAYNKEFKTGVKTSLNEADLMPYLNIENLVIETEDGETVYRNGQFASRYSNSTISFDKTDGKLFTAHIVDSDTSGGYDREYEVNYTLALDSSVRSAEFYKGEQITVKVNTKGERIFNCPTCEAVNGNAFTYNPSYNPTTGKMITYAHSSSGDSREYVFLYAPKVDKDLVNETQTVKDYKVTYTIRGAGKEGPLNVELIDVATITSSTYSINNSSAFASYKQLFRQYTHYKNVKVHYENQVYDVPSTTSTFAIGDIQASIEYYTDKLGFSLVFTPHNYNDVVEITYSLETDLETLNRKAVENDILGEDGKLVGTSAALTYRVINDAKDDNSDSYDNSGGSFISVSDIVVNVRKSNVNNGVGSKKWNIQFNTGLSSTPVTINDELELLPANPDELEAYKNATTISDIIIKVNNVIIYQNEEFVSGWEDTVTITRNGLKTTYVFADTTNKEYVAGNSKIDISYVSTLDFDQLDEHISSVNVDLKNTAALVKGEITDSAISINSITKTYKHTINKTYLGNTTNDLTETNWKIELKADEKSELNVKLSDTLSLGSEFGNYLSISKFKILYKENSTAEETVIYDSENGVNNLGDLVLSMGDEAFEVGKNGKYDFNLLVPDLHGKSSITILYTLKVDKEEYILAGETLDSELVITNRLHDEFLNTVRTVTGSSKVSADLTKKFTSLGKDSDGFTRIKWLIDVNLAEYYDLASLTNMEVTITDNISNVFGLEANSVEVRYLIIKSNGTTLGNQLAADKYELSTEDNTVRIKLLDPVNTAAVRISFITKVEGSITNVRNSVALQVGNKKKEVTVVDDVPIFAPSVFGVVYSRDMLSYSIYAQKYLDGKETRETFKFKITEVNSSGTEIENGYQTTSTNGEDGRVEFNGIKYDEAGTYYYKIQEVIEDSKYEYDNTEYIVKVNAVNSDDRLVVDSVELLDHDDIVFNNKTIKQSSNEEEITPLPENPNTSTFIKLFVLVIFVISITIGFLTIKKYRFLK